MSTWEGLLVRSRFSGNASALRGVFVFVPFSEQEVRQNLLTIEDIEIHWRKIKSFITKDMKERPRRAQRKSVSAFGFPS